jgi:hypothetical protein
MAADYLLPTWSDDHGDLAESRLEVRRVYQLAVLARASGHVPSCRTRLVADAVRRTALTTRPLVAPARIGIVISPPKKCGPPLEHTVANCPSLGK